MVIILIVRDDDHIPAFLAGLGGQRGHQVVGLEPLDFDALEAQGRHDVANGLLLFDQVVGHGRPVGFVVLVQLLAEPRTLRVVGHHQAPGFFIPKQLVEGGEEAVHRVGRPAVGGGQAADGVVAAVNESAGVHQVKNFGHLTLPPYRTMTQSISPPTGSSIGTVN